MDIITNVIDYYLEIRMIILYYQPDILKTYFFLSKV